MTADEVVYRLVEDGVGFCVAAVLTPESKAKLLARVPSIHPNVRANHVTLAFNPEQEIYDRKYLAQVGRRVRVRVVGATQDAKVQAVRVDGVTSENKTPHITISTAAGVNPAYSNELLAGGCQPVPRDSSKPNRARLTTWDITDGV